ncbi:TetR family transcriptional regulator [Cupriavidus sp. a3]|uniref:TetR family transcriptional regulator n=1 Tax=Cupriavidus sp. a3 TaxID=3242158 RepID=UPI003D9C27AB
MKSSDATLKREPRPRDREMTLASLKLARTRVREKGVRMSISAVALEAGVTPPTIHNVYPDFAEEIREEMGRGTRQQRDAKAAELKDARRRNVELRKENIEAKGDIARLASLNETLRDENARLRAQLDGKLTVLPGC